MFVFAFSERGLDGFRTRARLGGSLLGSRRRLPTIKRLWLLPLCPR
jgi:hypothetical protein